MTQNPSRAASQSERNLFAKAAVSAAILAVVSLQAYAAFLRLPCNSIKIPVYCSLPADPGLYPFLNYPMYSRTKAEGAQVSQYVLTATFTDGEEKTLAAEDFGLSGYLFHNGLMDAFRAEDYPKIKAYVDDYEAAGNKAVASLRLDSAPLKITRDGIVNQPSKLVLEVPQTVLKGENNER